MHSSGCGYFPEEAWQAFTVGEDDPAFANHLEVCDACRADALSLARISRSLRVSAGPSPSLDPSARDLFIDAVISDHQTRQQAKNDEKVGYGRFIKKLPLFGGAIAVTAAAVFLLWFGNTPDPVMMSSPIRVTSVSMVIEMAESATGGERLTPNGTTHLHPAPETAGRAAPTGPSAMPIRVTSGNTRSTEGVE